MLLNKYNLFLKLFLGKKQIHETQFMQKSPFLIKEHMFIWL